MGKNGRTMRGAEDPIPGSLEEVDLEAMEADEATATEDEEDDGLVVVEYVGHPPYGREFHSEHTIRKSSGKLGAKTEHFSFAGQGVEVPEDLVWRRETGWIVKVDRSLTDLLDALATQSDLKVHN